VNEMKVVTDRAGELRRVLGNCKALQVVAGAGETAKSCRLSPVIVGRESQLFAVGSG
jgi:hypothetical protein